MKHELKSQLRRSRGEDVKIGEKIKLVKEKKFTYQGTIDC